MKKNVVLALVAVMVGASSAHAAGGKDRGGKSEPARQAEAQRSLEAAGRSATTGADAGSPVAKTMAALESKNMLARLSPEQKSTVATAAAKDAELLKALETISKSSPLLAELNAARLSWVASGAYSVAKLGTSAEVEAAEAINTLVLTIGGAKGLEMWSKDTLSNMVFLVEKAAEAFVAGKDGGKTAGKAALEAIELTNSQRKTRLDARKIRDLCGKKV